MPRQTPTAPRARGGFTLLELLVVIGIISLLMALLLPAAEKVRHQAYIDKCASNLRQIGAALQMYANENHGFYPRTRYLPGAPLVIDTGSAAPDPFGPGGPQPNDLTSPLFLLMRAEHLTPEVVVCPYDDVFEYTAMTVDPQTASNFTDYKKNLGYSFANPYPSLNAEHSGYRLTNHMPAAFAVAADINPGVIGNNDDVTAVQPTSPASVLKKGISSNHEKDGMNVLYGDGHVAWERTPFVGIDGDNIYTNANNQVNASPASATDSVLLPTDD